jgi:hypothetical protein
MDGGQRIVPVDEMDLVAVARQYLFDGRMRAKTERTLEIRKLNELDRRARRTGG